ncbi:MAG: hypothetical protein JXQ96_01820 [Cyclobacteriaceae bacterium]
MAYVSVKLSPYKRKDGRYPVVLEFVGKERLQMRKVVKGAAATPSNWSEQSNKITGGYPEKQRRELNKKIDKEYSRALEIVKQSEDNYEDLDFPLFKKRLVEEPREKALEKREDLINLFDSWLKDRRSKVEEISSQTYSYTKPYLLGFREYLGSLPVEYFSHQFFEEFVEFISEEQNLELINKYRSKNTKPLIKNSAIQKHIRILKSFGRYLSILEKPIKPNFHFYTYTLKVSEPIGLKFKEFKLIYDLDFSLTENISLFERLNEERLAQRTQGKYVKSLNYKTCEIVRDSWVIGTLAGGPRISNLQTFELYKNENDAISWLDLKNDRTIINPMSELLEHVLQKYDYRIPNFPRGQNFNLYLKVIAEMIGLNRSERRHEYHGSKSVVTDISLKDVMTSKFMRKAFVSINSELGIPREISDAMSSHTPKGGGSDFYRQIPLKLKRGEMKKWDQAYKNMQEPIVAY